ncbi:D-hexose-6-phosphate mutarotase [Acinetobacter ursingii]|uniref:Putative glucose-6-phosphate 1-epimerase n=2 Tax=Acinetobacter TaxID=469 RepID=N9DDP2_9GAMM|nr:MULTISPECIES: D-hexose-6-phosphate mutarotase [Acinetobacter]MEC8055570.1 D-hexose-6-phosphate mutarotase [Pseudomonadota bacterium]NOZ98095.1 D-hexose-6-phosphate mutarotase [Gammaproteobacteria bacterium]ENV80759.1 hypothetical protein F942_00581 [Acinetobacter ursingii ANC 3649]MCU4358808.1 D-hexose-6-phosphate mutarotase [Acinetobacter ursingii]MCU4489194.1 D-hexose-6-phosphate mutarotase [Acinetobacter ursingii]
MINFKDVSGITIERLGEHGLKALRISNSFCDALIAFQGAQVLEFHLKHQTQTQALLWLSELNSYQPAKAIRGGIPLCFPWFGGHPEEKSYPSHGFARNLDWQLMDMNLTASGHQLLFELRDSILTRRYWDAAFVLQMSIDCGETLQFRFNLTNIDQKTIEFNFAWHSYFAVNAATATITGLAGLSYIDQLQQHQEKIQLEQQLEFDTETDRIYPLTNGTIILADQDNRPLSIQSNAPSAVIWNPWIEKAARLNDMPDHAWQDFVCIESAELRILPQQVEPGKSYTYQLEIKNA